MGGRVDVAAAQAAEFLVAGAVDEVSRPTRASCGWTPSPLDDRTVTVGTSASLNEQGEDDQARSGRKLDSLW